MRRASILVLAVAIALGTASVARSSPQFVAALVSATYSSTAPGSPSGLDALATFSDPGEPGGKPKELKKIKVVLHPGTRFDTSALPRCRASRLDIQIQGPKACPASTRVGTVRGEGVISTGLRFNTVAHLFNARRQIIVVVTIDGRYSIQFRDDVRGNRISINLAIPNGISLTRFAPHVPRHFRKRGERRKAYMRTPPTCPATGVWTTTFAFIYKDASAQDFTATTPCKAG
jgi:hypothetical protein